ncbi:protein DETOXIFICATION 27-like isoform X1 [Neltuma alba]|uniref:protein DETOXIFICATION 27-like isoform X1 n=1 Tax=Neltuma alba TaxID=207710 RepID=UPI0010A50403|nr:protein DETOXIFICATION 27-like isoform X1 [Prosopis alba]
MASNESASPSGEANIPLLLQDHPLPPTIPLKDGQDLAQRVWIESKKLWHVVGPSIFSRLLSYSVFILTQASAGHLGELELASMSIVINVILGFDVGLMLGMASALETLCGQAYGAKKYHMMGIYMQRSWIVLLGCCVVILPIFLFASPVLKFLGQPSEIAELCGVLSLWMIPLHFCLAFQFPLWRFLQSQLKADVIVWICLMAVVTDIVMTWLLVHKLELGVIGVAATINISWWVLTLGLLAYTVFGGCPLSWTGFSMAAFSGLWEFLKLSAASGVMLCLENWYYRILVLMTGNLDNAQIAIDALSICMAINAWEVMIPLAFLAATGVRVANELGAGNGKGAKFATMVSVATSIIIGVVICIFYMIFRNQISLLFSSSKPVLEEVNKLSLLLVFTILLNSVQPVLSGVAVGSGWQACVAYINLGCYYLVGLPLGFLMGWVFHLGVMGIWAGMIFGGTATQTVILAFITTRCNWDREAEKASLHMKKLDDQKPKEKLILDNNNNESSRASPSPSP